jgi:type II restriction/modification system DNA methylase subunit YeeA
MDKNAIKKYAVWARRELISRVSQRAALYEITDKGFGDASADSVLGRVISAEEKRQRQALIAQIREKGYEQVMEEIAYTWFNRFIALRFMEVNGYLPSRVRVFTDDENNFKPQILTEAINMELDGLDMEKVYALKNANDDDALFKYMIIVQCNALSSILPGMFQRISDYTELLFPDNLLREGSVIEQMVTMIPEEDWTDQVQIIGWLYQFYNIEPKAAVFSKKERVRKEDIPAATQLFTPEWIVRYMVENSLGRIWLEGHPNNELKSSWKYYLDEADQEQEVQEQLAVIRKEYASLKPEDIRVIDPCQGSGHILAYMFDVLAQIYESYGYTAREAAANIVKHNIWGLDIDDRATQLAYFSVMMKARQYDRSFFSRGIQPHVYAIQESNGLDPHCVDFFIDGREELERIIRPLLNSLIDAKEYGSILTIPQYNFDVVWERIEEIEREDTPSLYNLLVKDVVKPLIRVAQALSQKYTVVVTNPPYMPLSTMGEKINAYVTREYPDSKTDLYSVFIERCWRFTKQAGMQAMITMHSWMTLGSFENLRKKLLQTNHINMAHLGSRAFEEIGGEVVQTCAWVQRNAKIDEYVSTFVKLIDYPSQDEKEVAFFDSDNRFHAKRDKFDDIPGSPYSYWVSDAALSLYKNAFYLSDEFTFRRGITTGDNPRFMRLWQEVEVRKSNIWNTINPKWFMYNKGGSFRKWYGNRDYLLNWEHDGFELRNYKGSAVRNVPQQFRPCLSYSSVATGKPSFRFYEGFLNDQAGNFLTQNETSKVSIEFIFGLVNSVVSEYLIRVKNTTQNITADSLDAIPVVMCNGETLSRIEFLVHSLEQVAKEDWDFFENSWDFSEHPFIRIKRSEKDSHIRIEEVFNRWTAECDARFLQAKAQEEELNCIYIAIYGLKDLSAEVADKDISIHKADRKRDVKSLLSYAVGCMFGRYSLDTPGLCYAGGSWDAFKYQSFTADSDGIIPICDDEYFSDDIVGRFVKFIEGAFGSEYLEENLQYIANTLGGSGSSRDIIRDYFINQFFQDHCSLYSGNIGKRPIYWLFDSGKKNGFKCLIYMHRYQPDTIARIRTDYVHEQQSRYRTAIADLESRIANAGTGERVKLSKQLTKLQEQAEELRVYEEKIHHLADQMIRIDLDDGVKHNYAIFQDVLAKIK